MDNLIHKNQQTVEENCQLNKAMMASTTTSMNGMTTSLQQKHTELKTANVDNNLYKLFRRIIMLVLLC